MTSNVAIVAIAMKATYTKMLVFLATTRSFSFLPTAPNDASAGLGWQWKRLDGWQRLLRTTQHDRLRHSLLVWPNPFLCVFQLFAQPGDEGVVWVWCGCGGWGLLWVLG